MTEGVWGIAEFVVVEWQDILFVIIRLDRTIQFLFIRFLNFPIKSGHKSFVNGATRVSPSNITA